MATLALTAGLVFCVYGLISIGRYISPLPTPRKNHKLVTDGLFGVCVGGGYGGLVLAALGLAAITRSEGRLALAIVLWFVVDRKAKFEESCLVQRYGAEYKNYAAKTKKFIPFLY
ncbi:S-isoprenylcysteine O-methyltransferase [Monoraphidium neglectum]|uniref:S-isoprenylcysteine O-methyltransferase n=1 Tax=Monoraphidium neglectum TaxID=145388 RepID=A0A0D2K0V4_9CHLO|nr:S-isoprenylcysteine O-methyltransferase [Monoraphidium neglectum]KIZ04248.1 S-isoprenylcysteine O-methyltransferase [Monoraphidium neglectum]|eukprot:XP_013903267.1 S-isoprenylcysteine O-methyltransferase [Monoraphidium neglectum]